MARKSILSQQFFFDEAAAFAHVESILWPDGPVCPKCGSINNATRLVVGETTRTKKVKGETITVTYPARQGLWKCKAKECRAQFTVRMGTLFEESRLPMTKWLQAIYLLTASKKGISTQQLKRTLECDQKSAWFLGHRIRAAMAEGTLSPFGVGGGAVEVDETFIGRKPGKAIRYGYEHKMKVVSLVDRESGQARSMVVENVNTPTIAAIVRQNVAKEARLMTDEARHYIKVGREFADHQVVRHQADEYVRGDAYTNTIEGFFSVFKRGMRGVYQHCSERHLHRYLAEFDFRYSNRIALGVDDAQRARIAMTGMRGKRLTYRGSHGAVV
jgi:hypothetical protein